MPATGDTVNTLSGALAVLFALSALHLTWIVIETPVGPKLDPRYLLSVMLAGTVGQAAFLGGCLGVLVAGARHAGTALSRG